MVVRSSYLHNGNSYTGKMASLYWFSPLVTRINSLGPRQNRCHFADDIFKCIFLIENVWIPIKISLKFVPKGPINNIPAMAQIMAWRRPGDKPLSEPMMVTLPTHICVARPQWVNALVVWVMAIRAILSHHYCDITWVSWCHCPKSWVSWPLVQQLAHADN